jgi:hypothetical protein
VLVLRPRGQPLAAWLSARGADAARGANSARLEGCGAAAAAAGAARRACADVATRRILGALAAAHAAGYVHCDVRPGNAVVAGDGDAVVLVDWGLACRVGARVARRGVAAFAHARVFAAGVLAAPAVDAVAALYTWLAIACGDGGAPPWARAGMCDEAVALARQHWVEDACAAGDARVAKVALCAAKLESLPLGGDAPAPAGAEGGAQDALELARAALDDGGAAAL